MSMNNRTGVTIENHLLDSVYLKRTVKVDCYLPASAVDVEISLLLINDGQDLVTMEFQNILEQLQEVITPLFCVGLHCSADRRMEYGTSAIADYKGRGARAGSYTKFVMEELLPYLRKTYQVMSFKEKAFAGFSLGGLSAMDIVWNHPGTFQKVGIFSGSLWWRIKDRNEKDFNESTDRLMPRQIRNGTYRPDLKFFFQCGELDEAEDRNRNGVIDSIDDTLDVMKELLAKGYLEGKDMYYLQTPDGRHDVRTWARTLPKFLKWGWGK